jgi:hypothetical protein
MQKIVWAPTVSEDVECLLDHSEEHIEIHGGDWYIGELGARFAGMEEDDKLGGRARDT